MIQFFNRFFKRAPSVSQETPIVEEVLKPRALRVELAGFLRISFQKLEDSRSIRLKNISSGGLALLKSDLDVQLTMGEVIRGRLLIDEQSFEVEIKIVRQSEHILGAQFLVPSYDLQKAIKTYFQVELGAMSMSSMRPELLKEDPDGTPYFYYGKNDCELYVVLKDGQLRRFEMSFFGHYIEGGPGLKARHGVIQDFDKNEDDIKFKGSRLVAQSASPREETKELALRFLEAIQALSPEIREQLRNALKQ